MTATTFQQHMTTHLTCDHTARPCELPVATCSSCRTTHYASTPTAAHEAHAAYHERHHLRRLHHGEL